MKLYYRKVRLQTVDYREVIDTEIKLAWCDKDERHLCYDDGTFAESEKRILDAFEGQEGDEAYEARNTIQIVQFPGCARRVNINPHGLI